MDEKNTKTVKVKCPVCENEIEVMSGSEIGDKGECQFCGMTYEVVSIEPLAIESIALDK